MIDLTTSCRTYDIHRNIRHKAGNTVTQYTTMHTSPTQGGSIS